MRTRGRRRWRAGGAVSCVAALPLVVALGAAQAATEDGRAETAAEVLQRALVNRYELDHSEVVELRLRSGRGKERKRRLEMASKRIDGRLHSLSRFTFPEHLRGTAILTIEQEDRSDDHFVYLPALDKMRRVPPPRLVDWSQSLARCPSWLQL